MSSQSADVRLKIFINARNRGTADIRRYSIGREQLRRWSCDEALRWIVDNCVESKNDDSSSFTMQYMDDEGDWCTVQNDMEWQEAVRIASEAPSIFRLKLLDQSTSCPRFHHRHCLPLNGHHFHQLPGGRRRRGLFHRTTNHAVECDVGNKAQDERSSKQQDSPCSEEETIHYGIICDGCNQYPLRGTRHRCTICKGCGYDLCSNCFNKVGKLHHHEAHQFETINRTQSSLFKMCQRKFPAFASHIPNAKPSCSSPPPPPPPPSSSSSLLVSAPSIQDEDHDQNRSDKKDDQIQEPKHEHQRPAAETVIDKEQAKPISLGDATDAEQNEPQTSTVDMAPSVATAEQATSPYARHLALIQQMGFTDDERSLALLEKHRGNLQRVLNEYLN